MKQMSPGDNMYKILSIFLVTSLSLFLASCSTDSKAKVASKTAASYVTMPVNTAIAVTLIDSIDTDVHVTGSTFRATLTHPIVVNGHTLFAGGAQAKGILDKVVESGHLKTPAELNFSLTAIQDANGGWIDIGTNMIMETKGSHTNKEVAMIGGGAIVGGIIGKIVDRKGSTEIGAVAGAAAGTGLAVATGKQDIFYGAGTEVTFYSNQATQVALQ
jgi:hypothetical protein